MFGEMLSWQFLLFSSKLLDGYFTCVMNQINLFYFRNFDFLIPDAPELIGNHLDGEQDMSCKRNAFVMLIQADQDRALNYLSSCIDQVPSFGDILQLVIVELIYKVNILQNLHC